MEKAPESKNRRAVVEEDLQAANGAEDSELAGLAAKLTNLIRQQAPGTVAAIGVDLKDIEAGSLRLADIAAAGAGVRVEKAKIAGAIDISGVRAGVPPGGSPTGG